MSRDSTDAPALTRSTLMALRRVLHAFRDGWRLEGRLAAAARMAAEDARLTHASAAQMVVTLKREWQQLDEVRRLSPLDAEELRCRLVTLSIAAYFEPERARTRRAA